MKLELKGITYTEFKSVLKENDLSDIVFQYNGTDLNMDSFSFNSMDNSIISSFSNDDGLNYCLKLNPFYPPI